MRTALSNVLLASALAVTPLLANKQTVENATPFRASVHIEYAMCRDDKFDLAAGKSHTASSGACLVKAVRATVYTKEADKPESAVQATAYTSSGVSGDRTWQITGPAAGKYSVVRKTN
jgi:hypothetical protein